MSLDFLSEAAFQYWAQLDCPRSLKLYLMGKAGMWVEILRETVDPVEFDDPFLYAKAQSAVTFLKKNPHLPGVSPSDRKEAAEKSWLKGEESCYWANERLSPFVVSPLAGDAPAQFLRRARSWLVTWLRHAPDDEEIQSRARHGPGTTFSSSVANPTAADKFSERPTLTHEACWYLANIVGTMWGEKISSRFVSTSRDCIDFTRGNRFTTAPKTALVDRPIAVEASMNIWFQLAVGSCIRQRLKRFARWDLDHAEGVHQRVARQASIDGSFATIDLSNASDSLCRNLVKVLLHGTTWLEILEDLRSARTFFRGKWHRLEKFSSMGNGYTFELETAIFAALAAAVLELKGYVPEFGTNLFVFGDDIIVPTDTADLVVATLKWCGFEVNKEKTFLRGPFRESCGGDFFLGQPVRGYYFKDALLNDTQSIFKLHNGAIRSFRNCGVNSPWFLSWLVFRHVSPRLRCYGPTRLGDSVLHSDQGWRFKWENQIRWVKFVKWSRPIIIRWSHFDMLTRLACRLNGYGDTFGIMSRGSIPTAELDWTSGS